MQCGPRTRHPHGPFGYVRPTKRQDVCARFAEEVRALQRGVAPGDDGTQVKRAICATEESRRVPLVHLDRFFLGLDLGDSAPKRGEIRKCYRQLENRKRDIPSSNPSSSTVAFGSSLCENVGVGLCPSARF